MRTTNQFPAPRVLIIIPTYNERENLASLLVQLRCLMPAAHLLVVDDNSPDGTGEIACVIAQDDPYVYVLHREKKEGLGRAYIAGFSWALAQETHCYDYIVQMDADLSHNSQDVPRLVAALEDANADLVIGSRYVPGGGALHWGVERQMLSRLGNLYAKLVLGMPLNDLTGGFKCWRRETLAGIDFSTISSNGYAFQVEMNYRAKKNNRVVKEIPIIFTERRAGQSKMNKGIILEALLIILKMR